jgi:uncharacterized membrane protein
MLTASRTGLRRARRRRAQSYYSGGDVAFDRELTPALCAAGGLLLLGWGIGRRGVAGIAATGLGSWLLYQTSVHMNQWRTRWAAQQPAAEAAETAVVDEAILIAAKPDWLYRFCRDLGNMRQFAPRLRGVESLGGRYARWRLWSPQGRTLEWESTITSDEPGRAIAWRTTYERQLSHLGTVRFERDADDGGTVVTVQLEYLPPLGATGSAVVRTIGPSPQRLVRDALLRLKEIAETDAVAANDDRPEGAGDDPNPIEA